MSAPENARGLITRVPSSWLKQIRRYAVDNDRTMQSLGIEAWREWAQRHGVELPSDGPEGDSTGDTEPDAA